MTTRQPRIVILREPQRAGALKAELERRGFDVVIRPVTEVVFQGPCEGQDWIKLIQEAEWVAFTSRNAVEGLARGLGFQLSHSRAGCPRHDAALADSLRSRKVAVLGQSAVRLLKEYGIEPDVVESRRGAADLAKRLCVQLSPHSCVLHPGSAGAMPDLHDGLTRAGHEVRRLICYATVPLPLQERLPLDWGSIDAAVVAAPSTVAALVEEPGLPRELPFIAIGPTTAAALRERGLSAVAVSPTPDVAGVISAVEAQLDGGG